MYINTCSDFLCSLSFVVQWSAPGQGFSSPSSQALMGIYGTRELLRYRSLR